MGSIATLDLDVIAADGAVLVVEDGRRLSRVVGYMCEYLGLTMRRVGTDADLAPLLSRGAPLAVVCALEGREQDGCHVMKIVAAHDPNLPMLLMTGGDPALIGAAEAVEEACALTHVRTLRDEPGMGDMVEFLLGCTGFAGTVAKPAMLAA